MPLLVVSIAVSLSVDGYFLWAKMMLTDCGWVTKPQSIKGCQSLGSAPANQIPSEGMTLKLPLSTS